MKIPSSATASKVCFSQCKTYRYYLHRKVGDLLSGERGKCINFIMLNPSIADQHDNDPTVSRCEKRAIALGFSSYAITNIFAFVTPDPEVMKAAGVKGQNIVGPENNQHILRMALDSNMVVCAWGKHGKFLGREKEVVTMLTKQSIHLWKLQTNLDGSPCHPLYLPHGLKPKLWKPFHTHKEKEGSDV